MEPEGELIVRAGRGDTDAFGLLVGLYEKKVYNMARRMCGHAEDAFDLSQEVFIRVWRGLPSFRGDASFSTWLFRLTTNVCTDYARKKARRPELPLTAPGAGEQGETAELPDSRYSPERALERRDLREALDGALARLSPEYRAALTLRETAGLSYAEIARALGIEEGTVKSRIARARAQMRLFLTESGNFSPPSSSNET